MNFELARAVEERRIALERWRDANDELEVIRRRYIPVASYRKALREQIAETWSKPGTMAERLHGLRLMRSQWFAELAGSEHAHSIPSTQRRRNRNGTGLVSDHHEATRLVKAYGRQVNDLERTIERLGRKPATHPHKSRVNVYGSRQIELKLEEL